MERRPGPQASGARNPGSLISQFEENWRNKVLGEFLEEREELDASESSLGCQGTSQSWKLPLAGFMEQKPGLCLLVTRSTRPAEPDRWSSVKIIC